MTDRSNAGLTTLHHWNSNGLYSYQLLHPWHRDTHLDFLEVDGTPWLILSSASRPPIVYKWNRVLRQLEIHGYLPDAIDVWMGQQFVEVQGLPSRGSKAALPFSVAGRLYLAMGSDYSFSRVYLWESAAQRFQPFQELNVRGPRAFSLLSVDSKDLLPVSV
ncbi:leucine-rich repeat LGI family member 3 precursor-like [Arapaima gigas]